MSAIRLNVKVVPGSSRTRVVGWLGDELKVAVAAPPEGGRANAAVCKVLEEGLNLARGSVQIASGSTRAHKTLSVSGLSEGELQVRVSALLDGAKPR